jgi:acetolactate synthase-1/2/3 large subunit
MIKLSDYIVKYLESAGIKHIFLVSGGGAMHLVDSIGKSKKITYVPMHHEQACAMASEGYNRLSNKVTSAVFLTTGPGGTNALTGVLGAWLDSIPMLIISGQVSVNHMSVGTNCRQIGDQEFDIVSTVSNMTKYAITITDASTIHYHLEKAFDIMTSGRPGPVWLDIPLNIQASIIDETKLNLYTPLKPIKISDNILLEISNKLNTSKKPLIVVGNGVSQSKAYNVLHTFLNKSKLPIMTTIHSAIDLVNESYEYYCGRFGILGQVSANKIIQECDLLLVIGSRLPHKVIGYNVINFAKNAYKIMVDIDEAELYKNHLNNINERIISDAYDFLKRLTDFISYQEAHLKWKKYCASLRKTDTCVFPKHKKAGNISTYNFIEIMSKHMNCEPVVTSNGTAHVVTQQVIKLNPGQRFFTNVGCASMGYGLPAAIGACFSNNQTPVICIEGDGSIMMNIHSLQTVHQYGLPIKIFILNNKGYQSIKLTQQSFFNGHNVAADLNSHVTFPKFSDIAKSFNIAYFELSNNLTIDCDLKNLMNLNHAFICEVFVNPEEIFEPKVIAKGTDETGNIIPGELTDQIYNT